MKKTYFCNRCESVNQGYKHIKGSYEFEVLAWILCGIVFVSSMLTTLGLMKITTIFDNAEEFSEPKKFIVFITILFQNTNLIMSFLIASFYSTWRKISSPIVCSKCQSSELLPENSDKGKKKIEEILSKKISYED